MIDIYLNQLRTMHAHQSNLRIGRHSQINKYYHVTFTTKQRRPFFKDLHNARVAAKTLKFSDDEAITQTQCFVIMPDHIHWLFQLQQPSLSQAVQRVKGIISRELKQPIWQRGFHDHGVRNEESLIEISRYIIANPVRAGICRSVREYSHWDAIWLNSQYK